MTEEVAPYDILGSGAGGPLPSPGVWVAYTGYTQYLGGVVVGTPTGLNQGNGSINAAAIFINGSPVAVGALANYLPLAGGTLTGPLILAADPTTSFGAVTKQYADAINASLTANFANYLPLAGGTLTGALILAADPTVALGTATKRYVDGKIGLSIPDAVSDGSTYGRNNGAWSNIYDAGTY